MSATHSEQSTYRPVLHVYGIEALTSIAAVLQLTGIFFYTHRHFGWGIRQNLLLATALGVIYIPGALCATALGAALGRRRALLGQQIVLLVLSLALLGFQYPIPLALVLMAYSAVSASQWPLLESLASHASTGRVLSKRLSGYNLTWSAANVLALAVSGTLIQYRSGAIFVVSAVCHVIAGLVALRCPGESSTSGDAHLEPEAELLAVRKQALWLSRIALPSTYIVVASLNAMMPSLAVMRSIDTRWATLVSSVWFAARCAAFAVLGATTAWHTRPRLMLAAAALMLAAFLGVTLRPSDLLPALHLTQSVDLSAMVISQIFLGIAMGAIYSASLYFGMVLSQGSTEHGGYHEALIGLGTVLGPVSAYLADTLHPNQINFAVAAVAGLIGISLLGAVAASRRSR